jgi:hypothetical protein
MRDGGIILMIVSAIVLVLRLAYLQRIDTSRKPADID